MEKIVLLSCYELGHQPLSLAWPLAFLEQQGISAEAYDLAVQDLPSSAVADAQFIGISVPMHTAMRLGLRIADQIRQINPQAHINFFGHYAHLNAEFLLKGYADSVIAGEVEETLAALIKAIKEKQAFVDIPHLSTAEKIKSPALNRVNFLVPNRSQLPALNEYAHLSYQGKAYQVAYAETTRGCLHTCEHCPLTPVYQGRLFVVPLEVVLSDIRQQVKNGAQHVSFGDPDFLNGPTHASRIINAMHAEFPTLSFSFTAKVEHLLENQILLREFAEKGCNFIITACESIDDSILLRLNKGHTRAQIEQALQFLQELGIVAQPTWLPFTPWATMDGYLNFLTWVKEHQLIANIPAVQYAVRLLVPPGSKLLDHPDAEEWCGPLDSVNFSYQWQHADPRMDALQLEINQIVSNSEKQNAFKIFEEIESAAYKAAGLPKPQTVQMPEFAVEPPRLSENWFC